MDKRRDLNIASATGQRGFLSAASGIVKVDNRVFVVADDDINLAEFSLDDPCQPGTLHKLMPDEIASVDATGKPEFESLIYLAPDCLPPGGALLAVPSGSSPEKFTGVFVPLSEAGQPGAPRRVDFSSLYTNLADRIANLNIEGAVCGLEHVLLFQRGNNDGSRNAIIALYKDRFIDCLRYFHSVESITLASITDCELGDMGGCRLGFTDAASLGDGRIVFTAVAEGAGVCKGFALGLMGPDLQVLKMRQFDNRPKIEGIFAEALKPPLLWMVFDNANPELPSSLCTMALE